MITKDTLTMPRTGDYSLGKVYKLVSDKTNDIYICSTCQRLLCVRIGEHRTHYKRLLQGNHHYMTSYEILKHED